MVDKTCIKEELNNFKGMYYQLFSFLVFRTEIARMNMINRYFVCCGWEVITFAGKGVKRKKVIKMWSKYMSRCPERECCTICKKSIHLQSRKLPLLSGNYSLLRTGIAMAMRMCNWSKEMSHQKNIYDDLHRIPLELMELRMCVCVTNPLIVLRGFLIMLSILMRDIWNRVLCKKDRKTAAN